MWEVVIVPRLRVQAPVAQLDTVTTFVLRLKLLNVGLNVIDKEITLQTFIHGQ